MSRRQLWIQFSAVITKEVRQTVRDKRMMAILLVAPMFQLFIFGFAINYEVRNIRTVVVDEDGTRFSRYHRDALLAGDTLALTAQVPTTQDAEAAVIAGEASVAVVFPAGVTADFEHGAGAHVQAVIDGSDPVLAGAATDHIQRYFAGVAADGSVDVGLRPEILYNPGLVTAVYMVPGVAALLLLIITTVLAAMGLSRERELGTLEQLQVTPIRPGVLMVGKVVPFVVAGVFNVAVALTVGAFAFDVPLRGSFLCLGLGTVLYLMSTLGTGLFVSTVSRTQQQAFLGGILFVLPAVLLSGVMTSIDAMPDWLRAVTYVNPVRYYVEILRAVLLKDAGFAQLWFQLVALGVFGSALMTLAAARFQKRTA